MASKVYEKSIRERLRDGEISLLDAMASTPFASQDTVNKWIKAESEGFLARREK